MAHVKGESHGSAKLTAVQVDALLARHEAGGVTMRHLATEFGISPATVYKIVHGKTWSTPALTGGAVILRPVAAVKPALAEIRPVPARVPAVVEPRPMPERKVSAGRPVIRIEEPESDGQEEFWDNDKEENPSGF